MFFRQIEVIYFFAILCKKVILSFLGNGSIYRFFREIEVSFIFTQGISMFFRQIEVIYFFAIFFVKK